MRRIFYLFILASIPLVSFATTLEVCENAKYYGAYGMKIHLEGEAGSYVQNDSPTAEQRYRARFYLRLNNVAMADGESFEIFTGSDSSQNKQFILSVIRSGDNYILSSSVRDNSGSFTSSVAAQSPVLTSGWHAIEIDWFADSSIGYMKLWFDGVPSVELNNLSNDQGQVDFVRLGAPNGTPSGATGSIDLDLFESRRVSYIGLVCHSPQEVTDAITEWFPTYSVADIIQMQNAVCPPN
ncbi:MAG: hypothetical protein CSA81_01860 [Acidobacteria bacterium]|nr:MAG: hypothetical protein CSA81_01860 [Acidobacteriota bacterium]